ncbi:radical SAM family heme chaperone HemW [Ancylobacter polymorphus]|uniref:Heme chaperone HemW n=1 Tax=Ancylobacter polymorphus TaxID=223390 RepID=A0ABU0B947_9HYPH|nr:radical SAM family heme chaperone HemW [Ancylobacter polymorphus]MDQ0301901.1 oxygen-independent coproporphyrinogen-3 oxidase [Ancylobacter polymorphus]
MTERAPAPPPADPGFGVYVHWPFCKAKCPYCDFNSHVRHAPPDQARFVAAFRAEIAHTRERIGQRRTHSVFFGGGTPSLMEPATVGAILDAINEAWPLDARAEVTLEANPTSVEAGRFRGYRAAGVNRVSLGVQALDDAALKALGRMHSAEEALGAVAVARAAFERVSFDLIYARPDQRPADWAAELRRAIDEGCEHLSLYQLTIEEGTPFAALHRAGRLIVPEDEVARALWDVTQETTRAAGLPAYEISNHARPGAESQHNLLYWRYGEYAGIGPGAHGRLDTPEGRVATSTERGPEEWVAKVEAQGHGVIADETLTRAEQADEYLLMGLRLMEGIDRARFARLAGRGFDPARVAALLEDGMIEELPGNRLRATALGLPVLDALVADLAA